MRGGYLLRLEALLEALDDRRVDGRTDIPISGVTHDSRQVKPGFVFVCITGRKHDGHDFLPEAAAAGAAAAVVEKDLPVPPPLARVKVKDSRLALALLAGRFWDDPSRKLRLIGVTGTNGKSTTTFLCRAVLSAAGYKVGLSGTIRNLVGDRDLPVVRTTPEATDLQPLLAEMVRAGCTYAVMEVSSHALALKRVAGCEFDTAVFTNLTQDHLDFHEDLESYFEAKALLFRSLHTAYEDSIKAAKRAVINLDDAAGRSLLKQVTVPAITYGLAEKADVRAAELTVTRQGSTFDVFFPGGSSKVHLPLCGRFNVYNSLAALAVGLAEGVDPAAAIKALESFPGVPGRFESIRAGQEFSVIVDYAHTPDGLENVLDTAREIKEGRLVVVFGCGGDRDRSKRPVMGRIAATKADYCIITSDNPRTEEPEAILRDIEAGIVSLGKGHAPYRLVPDRELAITEAIAMARKGDVVLIAGKGHEDYQIFRDRTIHFDDREVAAKVLAGLGWSGRPGLRVR